MASSHFGTDWRDQWERVLRWESRIDEIRNGLPADGPVKTRALDDIYAFFMNCYHLADWVWRSGAKTEAEVRTFVEGDPDLSLCRDVCTGLKHFRADPGRALSEGNWSTATRQTPFVATANRGRSRFITPSTARWVITTGSGDRDMFVTADRCVEAWRSFLGL